MRPLQLLPSEFSYVYKESFILFFISAAIPQQCAVAWAERVAAPPSPGSPAQHAFCTIHTQHQINSSYMHKMAGSQVYSTRLTGRQMSGKALKAGSQANGQTRRQSDGQTGRQSYRQACSKSARWVDRDAVRWVDRHSARWPDSSPMGRQAVCHSDGQRERQSYGQAGSKSAR
jgi:hypothetical protein